MTGSREAPGQQAASAFSAILLRLCDANGAHGAALVDADGESVDYAGQMDAFSLRVAAAEARIILALLERSNVEAWQTTREILIRSAQQSYCVYALSDGYAIILVLPRRAFRVSRRALSEAVFDLQREAGLTRIAPQERYRWFRVEVQTDSDDPRRPRAVWHERAWMAVTVVGRFQGADLERGEVGYMTRFASGAERLLVREPLGKWFAGEPA